MTIDEGFVLLCPTATATDMTCQEDLQVSLFI